MVSPSKESSRSAGRALRYCLEGSNRVITGGYNEEVDGRVSSFKWISSRPEGIGCSSIAL